MASPVPSCNGKATWQSFHQWTGSLPPWWNIEIWSAIIRSAFCCQLSLFKHSLTITYKCTCEISCLDASKGCPKPCDVYFHSTNVRSALRAFLSLKTKGSQFFGTRCISPYVYEVLGCVGCHIPDSHLFKKFVCYYRLKCILQLYSLPLSSLRLMHKCTVHSYFVQSPGLTPLSWQLSSEKSVHYTFVQLHCSILFAWKISLSFFACRLSPHCLTSDECKRGSGFLNHWEMQTVWYLNTTHNMHTVPERLVTQSPLLALWRSQNLEKQ